LVIAGQLLTAHSAQDSHGDDRRHHHGGHDHAPGTRLVLAAATSATSEYPAVTLAYPDNLEYAKDGESTRLIGEIKGVAGY
jgi:hypothetical protein